MIAGHTALLALKSERPIKIVYDRVKNMVATTKHHPSIVQHHTDIAHDKRIMAIKINVLLNDSAYITLSPVVLSRKCIHTTNTPNTPTT